MVLGWMEQDERLISAMRMLGYLKNPYKCNKKDTVYKIMIHKTHKKKRWSICIFIYFGRCSAMFF